MVSVSIDVDHETLFVNSNLVEHCVQSVLSGEGVPDAVIGIVLSNHAVVRELNRSFLGHDFDTDVISFNLGEAADDDSEAPNDVEVTGEVYIDLDTAFERCAEFGASFEQEVCRYAIHGVLHLIGYDDDSVEARMRMRQLEDSYLSGPESSTA